MSPDDLTLLVLAKEPVAGKVKTRLTPAMSPEQAASLAKAALRDTLETVAAARGRRRILVLDGNPGDWIPDCFEVVEQVPGGLDARLAGAFDIVDGPAMLVGMDTPQIRPAGLAVEFHTLDSWIGPTYDGGFWAIGMREPDPSVFPGVPMSTEFTGREQAARLVQAGMTVGLLPIQRDVDTITDARAVAAGAGASRFAMEFDLIKSTQVWPETDQVYDSALRFGETLHMAVADGRRVELNVHRWRSQPDHADHSLMQRCQGATLDIGCGPGRLTVELTRRGLPSLGVDVTKTAVEMARQAGADAVCGSVFDPLPNEGQWDTVLLADGNLGISGDPQKLLARIRELLKPGGRLLIEPTAHEADEVIPVQLANGSAARSAVFYWAHLGPQAARRRALEAGFHHTESWTADGRHFLSFTSSLVGTESVTS
ncbi:MAG: DUF2064 domain-containing protein [Actinobacteria bacterium]|nr:DUF2064 domain-containing protein [Actinomycetota bacterium]